MSSAATDTFRTARDFLLAHRTDYLRAGAGFEWPALTEFNWALDWFDVIAQGNDRRALWIVEEDGSEQKVTFDEMATRSDKVAAWLGAFPILAVLLALNIGFVIFVRQLAPDVEKQAVPALTVVGKTAANPRYRFGAIYVPHGMIMEQWTPATIGADFDLKAFHRAAYASMSWFHTDSRL